MCCDATGDYLCPADRPSPIFTTFSCVLNTIFLVWAIVDIAQGPCDNGPLLWTILGLVSAVINIVFAIYLYGRFTYKVRHEGAQSHHAACKLFLYDWGVCLYILFAAWLIVWMAFAGTQHSDAEDDDRCGDFLTVGIILYIIYFVVGLFLIVCSMITECCRQPRWRREWIASHPSAAHTSPAPVSSPGRHRSQHMLSRVFGSSPQPPPPHAPYASSHQQQHGPPAQNPHYQV
jgi:hypothetical protein